ncbi:MAG TPA: SusC/RagA family TonB-linked outer membrane protein [Puia sp.]|nr:SusC/RagA family TonB-linked outer membrane protein [Puia sp.]
MRNKRIRLLLFMLICMGNTVLIAQNNVTVSGTVRDSAGNALPGVTVSVKGTKTGNSTDDQGKFRIVVPNANTTLVFSAVGFLNQEIRVAGDNSINIVLLNNARDLNEVIVTGFGAKKDLRKVGYSITEIKGDEVTRANNVNVVSALQGKVAGVYINQGAGGPSSSAKIRIRGNASLSNNNQPLVVLDGILIQPGTTGADSWGDNRDFGNIIKDLNPDDYESITVLKGSAASALYGSQALNGVLLITTKKGHARKGLGVSFSHTESFDMAYKLPDFQNTYGGGIDPTFKKDAAGNDIVDPLTAGYYSPVPNGGYSFGPKFDGHMVKDIDGRMVPWVANKPLDFFQTGKYINTNVAVEGGNDISTYRFSYSNLYNSSVMPNNDLKRNSFTLRATHKIGNVITLDASVNFTNSKIKNPILQGGNNSPLFAFTYDMPRNADINYYQHNFIDTTLGGVKGYASGSRLTGDPYNLAHTMWNYYENNVTRNENNLLADLDITVRLARGLNFLARTNVNNYNDYTEEKDRGQGPAFSNGYYSLTQSNYRNIRVQGVLSYTKDLAKDYSLNISAGGETFRNLGGVQTQVSSNGGLNAPDLFVISNSVNSPSVTVRNDFLPYATKRLDALYAYGDLTWRNMLTLNFSVRNDWSSALTYKDGHGGYSYTYPSVGLAWIFTELPSFKNSNSILSFGKLRASLGWTGSDADPYTTNSTGFYGQNGTFNNAGNGNQQLYTFNGSTLGNLHLKNQLAREYEFGADIRFFDNRLGIDVAYYKKNTFNQVLSLGTPVESGVSSRIINAGNIQNQGIEILLTATPIKSKNFIWNATVNFTRNRNKVIELAPGVKSYTMELAFGADVSAQAIAGKDYGEVVTGYGYAIYNGKNSAGMGKKVLGLAPYGTTGGYYTYMRSQDYDGTTKNLGNIMENYLASTTQEFRYKDFNLSFQIDAKIGGLMASATHQYGSETGNLKNSLAGRNAASGGITYTDNSGASHDDGIIPDGVLNDGIIVNGTDLGGMSYKDAVKQGYLKPIPAYAYYENLSQWSSGIREYSIFENSWVALREVSVGYNIPSNILKKASFTGLRVAITGRNLLYLYKTAKDGINPEGFFNNNSAGFAEYGGLPYIRSLGFTVKASF